MSHNLGLPLLIFLVVSNVLLSAMTSVTVKRMRKLTPLLLKQQIKSQLKIPTSILNTATFYEYYGIFWSLSIVLGKKHLKTVG